MNTKLGLLSSDSIQEWQDCFPRAGGIRRFGGIIS